MEPRHQRSLMSVYVTLQQLAEEVRAIVSRGVSPAHAAGQMAPLPPPERERLEAGLDAVVAEARALVERHAPALLAEHERPRPLSHTRSWVEALLGRIEGQIDDLDPQRLSRKYGALSEEEMADLQPRVAALRNLLARLRAEMARKR